MAFLVFLTIFCLTLTTIEGFNYLALCSKTVVYSELCVEFGFNLKDCFPWDTSRCREIAMTSNKFDCQEYKCNVIDFCFLSVIAEFDSSVQHLNCFLIGVFSGIFLSVIGIKCFYLIILFCRTMSFGCSKKETPQRQVLGRQK